MSLPNVEPSSAPPVGQVNGAARIPDWLRKYCDRGLRVLFYDERTKGPTDPGWNTRLYRAEDYRNGLNVGVLLGTELEPGRYLIDIDLDWAPGAPLLKRLLPATGFGFGRASRKISHAFYTSDTPIVTRSFDRLDGKPYVELRGLKKDGTVGFQTMVPPSIHPSGEEVTLRVDDEIGHASDIERRTTLYAIGCILLDHLAERALRHTARLAVAGFLLQVGLTEDEVIAVVEAVAQLTENDVNDVAPTVRSTAARLNSGERVTGAGALAEVIGEHGKAVVQRIKDWVGTDVPVLNPGDPMPSARAFVLRDHTIDGVRTLLHQGGVFYAYRKKAGAYHDRDEAAVRSDLYKFLEPAKRWTNEDKEEERRLLPFQPTRAKLENVLDALRAVCNLPTSQAPPCWLANDPGLGPLDMLACRNGLLHIPTRVLYPQTPHFFTLNGIDVAYDPEAEPPSNWLAFLSSLWPDDIESIATLQEVFGYLLTPDTRQQKILMMVGPPRSGKGLTGRILRRLVGESNTCSPTLASFGRDFGKQVLVGKTLALISDARIGGRTDTASVAETLLSISGEDAQTVERKFLSDWNGKLAVRFLMLTNELPKIGDASGALQKRFIVLVLKRSFYGNEDLGLFDRLVPELAGILNWALVGRDRLYQRGHFVQPASANELIQEFADLGSPEATFLREQTTAKPGAAVSQKELFAAWQEWCHANGREHAGTAQSFGRNVRAVLPWIRVTKQGGRGEQERYWEGLQLEGSAGRPPEGLYDDM